jgi:hypothetical protein
MFVKDKKATDGGPPLRPTPQARLLPIRSTSIPFRDRGLVAQEVDNPREILLLPGRKRGRVVRLFTAQVRGARRGCYRNLVPCIDMVFLFYKKHAGQF